MGIQPKKKVCDTCDLGKIIWKNYRGKRYCQPCWLKVQQTTGVNKPTNNKPLPRYSPKRIKENKEYTDLRKTFLLTNSYCLAKIPKICTVHVTDVHHKKGRGKYFLNVSTWLPVCRSCHNWI